jgi:hypothetical protein
VAVIRRSKTATNVITSVFKSIEDIEKAERLEISQKDILFGESHAFVFQNPERMHLFEKICKHGEELGKFCSVNNGVNTGNAASVLLSETKKGKMYRKILEGKDIFRYSIIWGKNWINYDPSMNDPAASRRVS